LKEHLEITISNNNHNQPRKEKERHPPHGRAPHCPTPNRRSIKWSNSEENRKTTVCRENSPPRESAWTKKIAHRPESILSSSTSDSSRTVPNTQAFKPGRAVPLIEIVEPREIIT
jgi:hypothetical protein